MDGDTSSYHNKLYHLTGDTIFTWRDPHVTRYLAGLITTTSTAYKYTRGRPNGGSSSLTGKTREGKYGHQDCQDHSYFMNPVHDIAVVTEVASFVEIGSTDDPNDC